ncbi:MAG: hypothetical protein GX647_01550 [Clostridiales bacterium]|jgi:hypothetical protein|nr:hypothetical protein [Clostridiales bacterium]OPZ68107.1 MAG: hypothetical protein BWY81_01003 [Firmicutes bacterium ADurb.Bin467]
MKRIAAILACALLIFQVASAVGAIGSFSFALPEGFELVEGEALEGYRQAAAADAGGAFDGEVLLARSGEKSVSVVAEPSGASDAQQAAEAIVKEYAKYIPGFESVVPEAVEAAGRAFVRLRFAVDGDVAQQYFLADGGTLYVLTFMGMEDAEAEAALPGFASQAQ